MNIKSNKKFWLCMLTYIIISSGDLVLTYIGTPDLSERGQSISGIKIILHYFTKKLAFMFKR